MKAIHDLGRIGKSAGGAVSALKDAGATVREHAARTWGEMEKPSNPAIPALIEALNDEEWSVRGNAAFALKAIGTFKATQAAREFWEEESTN